MNRVVGLVWSPSKAATPTEPGRPATDKSRLALLAARRALPLTGEFCFGAIRRRSRKWGQGVISRRAVALYASFSGLCLLALAGGAQAAEPRRRFAIAPKPYAEALIDLAVQANISLLGSSACGDGGQPGLHGLYTLDQALGRLLAKAPCDYRIVDAATVRITPAAATASSQTPR